MEEVKKGKLGTRKNIKKGRPNPKRAKDLSPEELRNAIVKQRECNAKALSIVERLLEPDIDSSWFLSMMPLINQCHIQDAADERAIIKLCGYPLCPNALRDVIAQRYHISTKHNKVYDVTERKKFCSNHCFCAFNFVKDQMLTSPLWMRDVESMPVFKLLPAHINSGGIGDEVNVGPTPENIELSNNEKQSKSVNVQNYFTQEEQLNLPITASTEIPVSEEKNAKENAEDIENAKEKETQIKIIQGIHNTPLKVEKESEFIKETGSTHTELSEKTCVADNSLAFGNNNPTTSSSAVDAVGKLKPKEILHECSQELTHSQKTKSCKSSTTKKKHSSTFNVSSFVLSVEKCLKEWITVDTLCYLYGENRLKQVLKTKGDFKDRWTKIDPDKWDSKKHECFQSICKRLNLLEIDDKNYDSEVMRDSETQSRKPVPDFDELKKEAENIRLQAQAFYNADMGEVARNVTFSEDTKENSVDDVDDPVVPAVHMHAQNSLRRKIVLDGLNRTIPSMMRTFGLRPSEFSRTIRELVATFTLSATNITFKPQEWTLLCLVLIKLLCICEQKIQFSLKADQSTEYINILLKSYNLDSNYLNWLTENLMDINQMM